MGIDMEAGNNDDGARTPTQADYLSAQSDAEANASQEMETEPAELPPGLGAGAISSEDSAINPAAPIAQFFGNVRILII